MAGFGATVLGRPDSVLAPRGFPRDARHNGIAAPENEVSCSAEAALVRGEFEVAEVMGRYLGASDLSGSDR